MMVPESPADLPVAAPANDSGGELQRERVEATNVAAPVAAPDPAETIRRALAYWSDSSIGSEEEREVHDAALAALDALLAERQQDKERIERLEKALEGIAHTSYALPGNLAPAEWWKHVASKRREAARAALAVEEDAE